MRVIMASGGCMMSVNMNVNLIMKASRNITLHVLEIRMQIHVYTVCVYIYTYARICVYTWGCQKQKQHSSCDLQAFRRATSSLQALQWGQSHAAGAPSGRQRTSAPTCPQGSKLPKYRGSRVSVCPVKSCKWQKSAPDAKRGF